MANNVFIKVSERNQFDNSGKSLEKFNSTEVEVLIDGELQQTYRIGGSDFNKPEYVGKWFKGSVSGLGFERISEKTPLSDYEVKTFGIDKVNLTTRPYVNS